MSSTSAPRRATLFRATSPEDVVEFDAIVSEEHVGDAVVTDHPVEDGTDISDHVKVQPETFNCRVIVSDHPIIVNRSDNAQPSVSGGDPDSRAKDAYEFIRDLKSKAELVGFSTTLRDYGNMIITSTSVSRDSQRGNIMDLSMSLRQVIIANTETVAVPDPVKPSRKKKTNLGKKNKTPATPATEEKTGTTLTRIAEAFGGG